MKKILLAIVVFTFMAVSVVGAANLVWDHPNADLQGVIDYRANFTDSNGLPVANPIVPRGEWVPISLPYGSYVVTVQARNVWGWSGESVPLSFKNEIPDSPINLRVEE